MPIREIIVDKIGEIIGYIISELIIEGKVRRGTYYWIRKLVTGKEREIPELKRIEKRYLFKKFRLKSDLNERIPPSWKSLTSETYSLNLKVQMERQLLLMMNRFLKLGVTK